MPQLLLDRRALLAAGAALVLPGAASAAPSIPAGGRLAFAVFRNGAKVGEHRMRFAGALTVVTEVEMTVKLGPVPVYRYRHEATERWAEGSFQGLESRTNANGKAQRVVARPTPGGLILESAAGRATGPAGALPLTHWNAAAFSGPLFNPQEGRMVRATAQRRDGRPNAATLWSLRGEVEIDDWYDAAGAWVALRGKLADGSTMEYRRI